MEPRKRNKEFLVLQVPLGEGPPLYNLSFLTTPACFLESFDEKTKLARGDKLWRRRKTGDRATAGHPLLKVWVPRLEPGWAPTVRATHLDGLSDFLVPHSEAQGIFGYQCHSIQSFFPSVRNKAHKLRPHPRGQKCYVLITRQCSNPVIKIHSSFPLGNRRPTSYFMPRRLTLAWQW